MADKESTSSLPGSKTDKRKQSLYFPESMLQEIKEEAARLDRSLSWVVQRAWKISRLEIKKLPERQRRRGWRRRRRRLSPPSAGRRLVVRARPGRDASVRAEATAREPRGCGRRQRGRSAVTAILSDGILCDGFIWKYLWEDLAPLVPLVHWHYRGHGRSAPPADPDRIDIAAHAQDLDSVRRHAGDPPCVLFGHSMGCQVALEAYRQRPEKVRGLVLLCGSFGNVTSTFQGIPLLGLVLPKLVDLAEKAPDVVRAVWSRLPPQLSLKLALKAGEIDPARVHAEDILPYLAHMTHVDFPMFLRMLRAAGEHTAGDILAHVTCPCSSSRASATRSLRRSSRPPWPRRSREASF